MKTISTHRTARLTLLASLVLTIIRTADGQMAIRDERSTGSTTGNDPQVDEMLNTYDARIEFTENKGQFSQGVLYRADFPLGQALVTKDGMLVTAFDPEAIAARQQEGMRIEEDVHHGLPSRPLLWRQKGHGWMMRFENSSPSMQVESRDAHEEVNNFFLGERQALGVRSYQEIWYTDVYKQVDVRYYPAADGALEYDIICKPGSDPKAIAMRFDGIGQLRVNEDGGLVMSTSLGDMTFPAPVVYQRINGGEEKIEASYRVTDHNRLSFQLGSYDRTQPLVIDPIAMRWATWVNTNSTGDNHGHCIWVDPNDGSIYVVARVVGTTDQITVGAFDVTANGNLEMIVGKYTEPAAVGGSGVRVWQTYIGGNNDDNPYAMEQGPDGNLYITGLTGSTNFPLLGGPAFSGTSIDQQSQTGDDVFVLKINTAGTSIKSCVVGGNGTENSYDLRLTSTGDVVVCAGTTATNLLTLNPGSGASNTNNGGIDALVFKVNQDLSSLVWMKNYGGSGTDQPTIMVQDNATGDIFVGGYTTSTNFPTLTPRQATRGGTQAGFLQKLNSAGTTQWSSYFSSAASSSAQILCMEFNTTKSELYFGGLTTGLDANNISASGVLDNSYNGSTDFFVCRMETDQDFLAATYVGGTGTEENMMGLNTDQNNDVYVFGYSSSTNFPVTALPNTALQSTNQGQSDKTFFKLETDLSTLLFSTYYGGTTNDYDPVGERGIKFSNCRIYTIVTAQSNNIPLTQGALNTTKNSPTTRYEPGLVVWANPPDILDNTITGNQTVCAGAVPSDITGSNPSYVLPTIVRNNVASAYPSLGSTVTFQWQISTDSVNWSDISGATGQDLLGSQIGVVTVKTFIRRIIGGDACILAGAADQVVTVNINEVTGDVEDALCNATATGSITANPTGTGPFDFLWSDGQTTQTATGLAAGPYSVTVTDFNDCEATANFVVGEPTALSGSAQVTNATCNNSNGGATASGSGGTPPYSYLWSTGAVGATLSGVPSGGYSVTITDDNECEFVLPVNIGGSAVPDANAGADTTITCLTGPEIELNGSSSTPGATYSWTGPGIVSDGNTSSPTVNAEGDYTLTVTAPNGCTNTDVVHVSVNTAPPGADTSVNDTLTCTTTSVQLDGSSPTGGVTFSWSGPGFTSTDEDPTVTEPGTYILTVTDPVNGCASIDQVDVIEDVETPNASAVGGTLTCNTPNGIQLNGGSTTPGVSFSWSGPGFSSSDEDPTVTEPGTYVLTVTAPNGCSNTANAEVDEDVDVPDASAVGGTLTCNTPNGIQLNGGSTTPGVSFSWSGPGFSSSDEDPTVTEPGTYVLTVTAPNGCSNTANAEVDEDVDVPDASAVGGTLTCNTPNGIQLNGGSTTPGVSFSWSGPGFSSSDEDPTVTEPGTYVLTVTAPNGCSNTANAEVDEDVDVPDASAVGGTLTCNTPNGIQLNGGSTTPGVSFSWSGPGFSSSDEDPTVTEPGTYVLTVTAPNGCSNTANAEVDEDVDVPDASAVGGTLTCNTPNGIQLNGGSTTPGVSFSWSGPGFSSSDEDPTVTEPGTYVLTVTAPNGCSNTANAEVDEDVDVPDASAVGGTLTCNTPNGIQLNGGSTTPGVSFSWSGPGFSSSDEDPTVTEPGTYVLTVTAPNGCSNTANAEVDEDVDVPDASAVGGTLTCNTPNGIQLNGGSTTPGVSFSWSGPGFSSSDEDPTVTEPGTYVLTVTAPNGCSNTANAEVDEDVDVPDASAVGGTLTCNTPNGIQLNGGSTTPGVSFSWSGPGFSSSDEDPTVTEPGTYVLTVTAPNGCSNTANAEVDEDVDVPDASAVGGTLTCNTPNGIQLNGGSTTPGVSFSWSGPGFSSSDEDPTVTEPGTYVLTVTAPNGCSNTANAEVDEDVDVPDASAVGGTLTCNTPNGIQLNGGSTTPGVSFSWSGPGFSSSDEDPTVTEPGTYVLTVTAPNGCSNTANAEVDEDVDVPDASAVGGTLTCNTPNGIQLNGGSTTPGVSFSWSGPGFSSSDEDPTVTEPGTYVLTVTAPNGCSNTANAEVDEDVDVPDASAVGGTLTCNTPNGIQLNGGSTTPGVSFSWSGPGFSSSDEDPTVTEPGTYVLTVTAPNACSNTANAEVDEDVDVPDASAVGGTLTCNTPNGIQLNGGSTTPGVSFSWSGPGFSSSDEDPTVTEPGTYVLTVTAPNGCSNTANAEVDEDVDVPDASAVGGTLTCNTPNGIQLNGGSTTPGVSFSWSGPGFSSSDEDPTVTEPGTYVLTVTAPNGCSNTANAEVDEDVDVPDASAVGGTLTCNTPNGIQLNGGSTTPGVSFSWSGPGFSSSDEDPTVTEPGTYVLTVTAPNGCSNTANAEVDEDVDAPNISAEGCELNCEGDPCQLNGSSTAPGAQFAWSSPNGFSSGDEDPFVTVAGFYTLTVTGANGCTSSMEVAVTQAECGGDCELQIFCPPDTTVNCGTCLDWTLLGQPFIPTKTMEECPDIEFISWSDWTTGICPKTVARTWTVGDESGAVASCVQTITVIDTMPPVLYGVPEDTTVQCGKLSDCEPPKVLAEDNCKQDLCVHFEEEEIPGECKGTSSIIRTWTATDDCGNTTFAQQIITVVDNTPPVIDCWVKDMTVCCKNIPEAEKCTAWDCCTGSVEVAFDEQSTSKDCQKGSVITRTWTATDGCGNTSSIVQTITVDPCDFMAQTDERAMMITATPNPFREGSTIRFIPLEQGYALLDILDSQGRVLGQLFNGTVNKGQEYSVYFQPSEIGSGMYVYRLNVNGRETRGRLMAE